MPLDSTQLHQLGSAIDARRRALVDELRKDAQRARGEPYAAHASDTHDSGDESVADLIADLDNADTVRDAAELRELERARERIAAGTYGECADCGLDIEWRRLQALPGAMRCVRCQQRFESTHATPFGTKL
jgi:DnaK suppressor protein